MAQPICRRITITQIPYPGFANRTPDIPPWTPVPAWPCRWVSWPRDWEAPLVAAFRLRVKLAHRSVFQAHVSADERYELFVDGRRAGRGPERGDRHCWHYETYEFALAPGEHVLVARVWQLGSARPWAQASVYPGFLFSPDSEQWWDALGTGRASWEVKRIDGYGFERADQQVGQSMGCGPGFVIDAAKYPWGVESGAGGGWAAVEARDPGNNGFVQYAGAEVHLMAPAELPAMGETPLDPAAWRVRHVDSPPSKDTRTGPVRAAADMVAEREAWLGWLKGGRHTVPRNSRRRVIVDLGTYVCAYPAVQVSGGAGARLRVRWAEALTAESGSEDPKGNRDEIDGRRFVGFGDTFLPDGGRGRVFEPLWWRAGRYLEIVAETAGTPLALEGFALAGTGYPLADLGAVSTGRTDLRDMLACCRRTLAMCMHETYMDCPYYEQLMYVGDTRLQVLLTYVLSADERLPMKALAAFERSRLNPSRLVTASAPSGSGSLIPPFALWWIAMVHDFMMWRGDREVVAWMAPGVRDVLERFLARRTADGVVENLSGWNFVDGVSPALGSARPAGGGMGVSGPVNWQVVMALRMASEIESWLGETELACRWQRLESDLARAVESVFWSGERRLLADDPARSSFSEHTQCLALLSGGLSGERRDAVVSGLFGDPGLARASAYFTHYLFEACALAGRGDVLFERLAPWLELAAKGFRTTPEYFGVTRSDCHAWSAHPLYHFLATVLGVRPAAPGFEQVAVRPLPGPLPRISGTVAHPRGVVRAELAFEGGTLTGTVQLPEGVSGSLLWRGNITPLVPGAQAVAAGTPDR